MEAWVKEAGRWLEGDERGREVLFRASSAGHDECHEARRPTNEVGENPETRFNWAWIPKINEVAKVRPLCRLRTRADGARLGCVYEGWECEDLVSRYGATWTAKT